MNVGRFENELETMWSQIDIEEYLIYHTFHDGRPGVFLFCDKRLKTNVGVLHQTTHNIDIGCLHLYVC